MFGFVIANTPALSDDERRKYRAAYCGLCRALRLRSGSLSRLTLNYDMTFLVLVLSSIYEDEGTFGEERCFAHPAKRHEYWHSDFTDYAADMNIALAYYDCLDNWRDEHSPAAFASARFLRSRFEAAASRRPRQCDVIRECLGEISAAEERRAPSPDICANSFGRLMGELFAGTGGIWSGRLRSFGEALGRFIYIMDACVDYTRDIKHGSYNPLVLMSGPDADENALQRILNMLIGDCALEFEKLPMTQDLGILRNVLYSGVWLRYELEKKKRGAAND